MVTTHDIPRLIAVTRPIDDFANPIAYLGRTDATLWWRRGEGLIGLGEALRLSYGGPDRISQASSDWRALLQSAQVVDPLRRQGTGLVALGTMSFSASSEAPSILVVPRTVIGRRGGVAWITHIRPVDEEPETPEASPRRAEPLGSEVRIHFTPGEMTPERYQEAVARGVELIATSTELNKLVLARDVHARFPADADLRPVIQSLALTYPECWTFSVDGLIGASPETLVSVTGGVAYSRVLAGSAARGRDKDSDNDAAIALAASHKELDEHELAVRTVADAFRGFATEVTASDYPFALKLPNLWHLASEVGGRLRENVTPLDAVAALHPTGAVAGAPRSTAARVVEKLEPFDRGRYSGPVGWIGSTGDSEWAVAIRCAQMERDGGITAWAGCGIVPESEPGHELAETKLKLRPILDAFG